MDHFEQKIYELTEKLQTLTPKQSISTPPTLSELQAEVNTFESRIEQQKQQLERRLKCLAASLDLYEEHLQRISSGYEAKTEKLMQEHQACIQSAIKSKQQKLEELERSWKTTQCQHQEIVDNQRCEFEISFKSIKKQIEKELALHQKQLNLQSLPGSQAKQSKLQRQYLSKIMIIEDNERKKAEKINELNRRVKKRIISLYNNTSSRISSQKQQLRSKYEKIKRLFALIADI